MQQKSWGTSFVEATQIIALLNLFLELMVVHSGLWRIPCWASTRWLSRSPVKPNDLGVTQAQHYALEEANLL